MELVSIIIPTYKGSTTICRAVDSALSQDYKNIEVVIVDDNGIGSDSQIETEKKIAKYYNQNNVRYIKHKVNINGSAARNTGVREAKGEYIALLDDDDVFLPSKIRLQIEILAKKTKDYAVCYTSYENIFENGRKRLITAEKSGYLCFELLSRQISVLSSILLIRKSAWEDIGGFDESFKRDQDQEFCARLLQKYKIAVVPEICMVRYVLKRNVPANIRVEVKYREFYISKMNSIINTFNENQQKLIYGRFYTDIAKRYFKTRKLFKCTQYIFKSKTPILAVKELYKDFIAYKKNVKEYSNT